jgi:hypothetical protein
MKENQPPVAVTEDTHAQGLVVPEVTWYKHAGLRKLYLMMPILFLGKQATPLPIKHVYEDMLMVVIRLHDQRIRWLAP